MNIEEVKQAKTKDEASWFAVDWQVWQGEHNLSMFEYSQWEQVFSVLAEKFDLTEEFKENGII